MARKVVRRRFKTLATDLRSLRWVHGGGPAAHIPMRASPRRNRLIVAGPSLALYLLVFSTAYTALMTCVQHSIVNFRADRLQPVKSGKEAYNSL